MAKLTKLRLCLTVISLADEKAIPNRTVAKVLSNACDLRCLVIEIGFPMGLYPEQTGTTALRATLGGCSFPKLLAFILAFGSVRQDELFSLFDTSPHIEVLVLDGMTLQSGHWKEFAESARQHLPIKTIQMHQPSAYLRNLGQEKIQSGWTIPTTWATLFSVPPRTHSRSQKSHDIVKILQGIDLWLWSAEVDRTNTTIPQCPLGIESSSIGPMDIGLRSVSITEILTCWC